MITSRYNVDIFLEQLETALDLVVHKYPKMRILEVGNEDDLITGNLSRLLKTNTAFKLCQSYVKGHVSNDHGILINGVQLTSVSLQIKYNSSDKQVGEADFDMIIFTDLTSPVTCSGNLVEQIKNALTPEGLLLARCAPSMIPDLEKRGFVALYSNPDISSSVTVLARSSQQDQAKRNIADKDFVLVERDCTHVLNDMLEIKLSEYVEQPVKRISLHQATPSVIKSKTMVITTVEVESPLLSTMTAEEMSLLKTVTDKASNLLWVTGGGLLKAMRPDFALVSGLSRALMLEQLSLKFVVFDTDETTSNPELTASNIVSALDQMINNSAPDFEFIQHEGVVHISRFVPEEAKNQTFRQKLGTQMVSARFEDAKPCQLSIEAIGQLESIYFRMVEPNEMDLEPSFVEVNVKALGLNAKDLYFLFGRVDTTGATCNGEFSGLITKVGNDVSTLKPGDRVVVMAPGYFATTERVPEWACCKLRDGEEYSTVSTLSTVYATALYALHYRAHILAGESILIQSASSAVGIAATQIAQLAGAKIYATVSTNAKKEFLTEKFGLKEEHIFNSRDSSFLHGILTITEGRGVDVILTGGLLHDSCKLCAEFGRFVEIGKRDIIDAGRLGMEMFRRNVTFTAFDFSDFYSLTNQNLQRLQQR